LTAARSERTDLKKLEYFTLTTREVNRRAISFPSHVLRFVNCKGIASRDRWRTKISDLVSF
jgi:hypothetical protein